MRPRGALRPLFAAMALAALVPAGTAAVLDDTPRLELVPLGGPAEGAPETPIKAPAREGPGAADPGFAQGVRDSLGDGLVVAGLATLAVAGLGLVGIGLVTRYIPPEEALKNPQRAMLYGFVRGNPGVHLKRLSDEFHMKTSSILWHIRKLESAELVRSERANGFRVFYPTAGGVEVRNVSRAVTALQNPNASMLFAALEAKPGIAASPTHLAGELAMHPGTARWHLKKLKEFGLVEEVPGPEGARYLPTPLGRKAFRSLSSTGPAGAAADAALATA